MGSLNEPTLTLWLEQPPSSVRKQHVPFWVRIHPRLGH